MSNPTTEIPASHYTKLISGKPTVKNTKAVRGALGVPAPVLPQNVPASAYIKKGGK